MQYAVADVEHRDCREAIEPCGLACDAFDSIAELKAAYLERQATEDAAERQVAHVEAIEYDAVREAERVLRADATPLLYEESLAELSGEGGGYVAVIPGLAYRGLKTLVVGLSKAGKSWTTWGLCAEAVRSGMRVKYFSEESRQTVAQKLETFRLEGHFGTGFRLSRRGHELVRELPWPEVVARMADEAKQLGLDLIVVDTLRPWLGLAEGQSDSPEVIGAAIDALSAVTETGCAIVAIHQAPWGALRARGSTEYHATADIVIGVSGEAREPRELKLIGDRTEQIPEVRTLRWSGNGFEDLGGHIRADKLQRLDELLKLVEGGSAEGLTVEDALPHIDVGEKTLRRYFAQLESRGAVIRVEGAPLDGHGSTPDRWRRPGQFSRLLVVEE